ncbi:glycosyltransferase [Rhodobacterales bacterium HKCCE2091]|nr:glycosyltransferase [Rhodobacterales bacterium HKCCE2091]
MTRVSVVIPAYNASTTLDRTLDSVRAQTVSDIEILVVDDGSVDDTAAKAARHADEDPRVRVISQPNAGVAAGRNAGIAAATGDWVAPLDADDIWHPRTVERFLAAADAAPEPVVFVYTWSRRIDGEDRVISDLGTPEIAGRAFHHLLAGNFIRNASATMLDREAVQTVGGYDRGFQAEGAFGAEDIDLYLRLARLGPIAVAPGYHVGYRQMAGSMSGSSAERMRRSVELVLEKVERETPGVSAAALDRSRANYDLYAAGLSFSGGRVGDVARYAADAMRKAPVSSFVQLGLLGAYATLVKFRPWQMPLFADLDPDRGVTLPVADVCLLIQERLAGPPLHTSGQAVP